MAVTTELHVANRRLLAALKDSNRTLTRMTDTFPWDAPDALRLDNASPDHLDAVADHSVSLEVLALAARHRRLVGRATEEQAT